jgi:hypothetical protein
MNYDIALGRAWDEIKRSSQPSRYVIPFLTETYEVNADSRTVLSNSTGKPSDEITSMLVLHYLIGIQKQQGYCPSGVWISAREVKGGISFLPAFQESVIKPLAEFLRKHPEEVKRRLLQDLGGRVVEGGDIAVEVTAFPGINVRIMMWLGDEELPGHVAMLFDESLARILAFEDIVVLLGAISKSIIK